jgi:CubicO group peptidase (beta-lactamase class C family)
VRSTADPEIASTVTRIPRDLAELLDTLASTSPAPATAIAVVDPVAVIASTIGGVANLHTGELPTARHWWDLASLTKQLVTLPPLLDLASSGAVRLDQTLGEQWGHAAGTPVGAVTLEQLLSYRGGFPESVNLWSGDLPHDRSELVRVVLGTVPDSDPAVARYSDIGFIAAGELLTHVLGQPLHDVARGQGALRFSPPADPLPGPAVATEDCLWRGRVVVGSVHDENASALGGVAGHAGAFGTLSGVAEATRCWLARAVQGDQSTDLALSVLSESGGDRFGLGWRIGKDGTAGATGFVGNRVHLDPERRIAIVILTNRIHPHRTDRSAFSAWTDRVIDRVSAWAADPTARERT